MDFGIKRCGFPLGANANYGGNRDRDHHRTHHVGSLSLVPSFPCTPWAHLRLAAVRETPVRTKVTCQSDVRLAPLPIFKDVASETGPTVVGPALCSQEGKATGRRRRRKKKCGALLLNQIYIANPVTVLPYTVTSMSQYLHS